MTAISVEFDQGLPGAEAWPVSDSGEREYLHATALVTAAGDTTICTPAAGMRIRVRYIYTVNKPTAETTPVIRVLLGVVEKLLTFGIAKRQVMTGAVDAPLIVNLSEPGIVAVTVIYEEIP